uniref:hypothetical protein n=1 Tax=Nocardia donostiensis TaxID=1538463 RepID=UPI003CCB9849
MRPPVLHLFIAGPSGFVILLGGIWDRVPIKQTYEDLRVDGYEPASSSRTRCGRDAVRRRVTQCSETPEFWLPGPRALRCFARQ